MKDKIVLLCKGEIIEFCCLTSLKDWIDDTEHEISLDVCEKCKGDERNET